MSSASRFAFSNFRKGEFPNLGLFSGIFRQHRQAARQFFHVCQWIQSNWMQSNSTNAKEAIRLQVRWSFELLAKSSSRLSDGFKRTLAVIGSKQNFGWIKFFKLSLVKQRGLRIWRILIQGKKHIQLVHFRVAESDVARQHRYEAQRIKGRHKGGGKEVKGMKRGNMNAH